MKGTRRHELEQNLLADWIGKHLEKVKPYTNSLLGAILLTVIIVVGYNWWSGQTSATNSEAWQMLYSAMASETPTTSLENIVEEYSESEVSNWAAVMAGDRYLAIGCGQRFTSLANANQELERAIANYGFVLENSKLSILKERATFGLARARETLGKLQKAREEYETVVTGWPNGIYSGMAKQRIEDLKQPATKEFYDKFAKFDPKPQFADEPGTPGQRPAFDLNSLPEKTKALVDPATPKLDEAANGRSGSNENGKPEAKPAESEDNEKGKATKKNG